jgi:hypothetical protein
MILLGKLMLGMAGVGLAGAGVLCSEGLVQVKVVEKSAGGAHVHVLAPAMLGPIALRLAPRNNFAEATRQIQPYMPVVRAALDGLRDADDVVLVEVNEPGEHLQVSKLGGSIVVNVNDLDETVYVSAPIRAISSTFEELADASPYPQ